MSDVSQYLWAHVDLGSVQWSASWLFGKEVYKYSHGDEIMLGSKKGIFRIFDKDYDKEWIKNNVDELKELWEKRRVENGYNPTV